MRKKGRLADGRQNECRLEPHGGEHCGCTSTHDRDEKAARPQLVLTPRDALAGAARHPPPLRAGILAGGKIPARDPSRSTLRTALHSRLRLPPPSDAALQVSRPAQAPPASALIDPRRFGLEGSAHDRNCNVLTFHDQLWCSWYPWRAAWCNAPCGDMALRNS